VKAGPAKIADRTKTLCLIGILIGVGTFTAALIMGVAPKHLWGAYYVNLLYFMGLSAGAVMTTVIFQITRALWSPAIRRIAEAHIAFLPWALILLAFTWFGKEYLFPWGTKEMPGKELWMTPSFVYIRNLLLLSILFYMMWRFVRSSIRGDVGMLLEGMNKQGLEKWRGERGFLYNLVSGNWRGLEHEVATIQPRMSRFAPVLAFAYAIIYSIFAFEMIMGMDPYWISNMFGGFIFVGNIYLAWAVMGFMANSIAGSNRAFGAIFKAPQRWDIGKLTFGFCMLWGYLFFSQFLPQWYGNLPEETQWMILRTRDWSLPWIKLAWFVFPACFVFPFLLLLSRDVKRTPWAFGLVACLIGIGMWFEKYLIVMPNLFPSTIPFGFVEPGLFIGFLSVYVLSVRTFLGSLPMVPISHPLTHGSVKW
jgi:hypothetical protein